jgi:hypothetical protein
VEKTRNRVRQQQADIYGRIPQHASCDSTDEALILLVRTKTGTQALIGVQIEADAIRKSQGASEDKENERIENSRNKRCCENLEQCCMSKVVKSEYKGDCHTGSRCKRKSSRGNSGLMEQENPLGP